MKKTLIPFLNFYKSYYDINIVGKNKGKTKGGGEEGGYIVFCTVGKKGWLYYILYNREKRGLYCISYCMEKRGVTMNFKL